MGKKRFFSLAFSIAFLIGPSSVISIGHVESISSQRDDKEGNIWGGRKSPSGVISPMAADAEGFRRCLTHAEYESSGGLCSTMPNNTAYTSDYCVVYWIYAHNSKLGDKYIWKYYRPDGQLYSDDMYWEYVYYPPWDQNVLMSSNGMTWMGSPAHLYCGFTTKNLPYVGEWRVEIYYNTTLVATESFFIEPALTIRMPADNLNYCLEQDNYTKTPGIPFMAEVDPGCGSAAQSINWTLNLNYHTSDPSKFTYIEPSPLTFVSQPGVIVTQGYKSLGGLLTVHASAVINGGTIDAQPVTITITGPATGIPDESIERLLLRKYHGETPNLLVGLAWTESSFMQFRPFPLFERTLKWPNESIKDHGSHVGLMMVVTTMAGAWDWLNNIDYGVYFFYHDKTDRALANEQQMRDACGCNKIEEDKIYDPRGLIRREDMVLEAYGSGASSEVNKHIYTVEIDPDNGTCKWIKNILTDAYDYVYGINGVRTLIHWVPQP